MKYIILCLCLLAVTYAIAFFLILLADRHAGPMKRARKRLFRIIVWIVLILAISIGYLQIYYHADPSAEDALTGTDTVSVTEMESGWYFDGHGEQTALVFYPGAKVDPVAYAPLMHRIAEEGIDCFLVRMPFHMAILDSNAAADIMESYSYDEWILAGHSLGGTTAALFASSHSDEMDGLVLLAAYSTKPLREDLTVCSIYGSQDEVLDREAYEKNRTNLPADTTEYCIEGGNHAQYAFYGEQKGDGTATISPEEQIRQTAETISSVCIPDVE